MAHPNIDERRKFVERELSETGKITFKRMVEIGKLFNCSHSAIRADVLELKRNRSLPTPYVGKNMREVIHGRDGKQCKYCGTENPGREYVVEHVIPASLGGVGRSYNLVISCQSCNSKKRQSVWIPSNLDAITEKYPEWKLKVLSLADSSQLVYCDEPLSVGCVSDSVTHNPPYLEGRIAMKGNNSKNTSRIDWAALESMTDDEIDYSDIPPLTDEFFEQATLRIPAAQARNTLQLDAEVMAWFRSQGGDYKELIHSVLRRHIESSTGKQPA